MFFGTGQADCTDCDHDANGRWSCSMNCCPRRGAAPTVIRVMQDGGDFYVMADAKPPFLQQPGPVADEDTVDRIHTYPGLVRDSDMHHARTARFWFLRHHARGVSVEWIR